MNSLLKKRLPGILAAGLVTLAVGAASVTPAAASDASASALTAKQKKAKAQALKNCNKKRTAKQRKTCKRAVNKKYARISRNQEPPKGKTWTVNVTDPYVFIPNQLNIKVNDSILWDWKNATGREPHDVTPVTVPAGVDRNMYKSSLMIGPNATFKRQFTKPGDYSFVCSIHFQMTMNVNVSR